VGGYVFWQSAEEANVVTVSGLAGSEKIAFLENPKVVELLRKKYGLKIEVKKSGSVEMIHDPAIGHDFLWPASEINAEMYRENGAKSKSVESVFYSPIVFYSWDIVVQALQNPPNDLIAVEGDTYYLKSPDTLFKHILAGKTWKEIGLSQLFGNIVIKSTDPTKSNSGNMFAALLANSLNKNNVVTETDFDSIRADMKSVFQRQGYMEHSSGVLFQHFVDQGVGAYPVVVGYENQLVEYSLQNRESLELIRDKIRILYPRPTVWASHPFIAITDKAVSLLKALQDHEIQRVAWEEHGFRSGGVGAKNDPKVFALIGLPASITSVMPTPNARTMTRIIEELSN
jgi:hypothetical protein